MRVFVLSSLIIGCFFGAGFVSGKEISAYFSVFGGSSYLAIVLSCLVLFLLLNFFLRLSSNVKNFSQFVGKYFGKVAKVVEVLFALCLIILVGSMIAASGEVSVGFGMPRIILMIVTIVLAIRVVMGRVGALGKLNIILVPTMVIIVVIASIGTPMNTISFEKIFLSATSGVEYAFMNIITLGIFVLEIGGEYSSGERYMASAISCIVIMLIMLISNNAIIFYDLQNCAMPTMELAAMRGSVFGVFAKVAIWFGLFSTLTSFLIVLTNYFYRFTHSYIGAVLVSIVCGGVVSMFGFGSIVSYIYTIIGIIGIIIVINALIIDKKNTREKSCIRKLI